MKRLFHLLYLFLSITVLLAGCNGGSSGTSSPDTTPPKVISTVPAADALDVAVGATITATFSESMKAASLNAASFIVTGPTGTVDGAITTAGAAATFTPSAELATDATYTATITTGAQDSSSNALEAAYSWQFTTSSGSSDSTAPVVVSVSPEDSATDVAADVVITAVFSETLDCTSVTDTSFTLTYEGTATGTVACNGATATFTPDQPLYYYNTYTATISTAVTDAAGNALENNYSWSFKVGAPPDTTPPIVASTSPAANAANVGTGSAIIVTFSEPMLASSITATTFKVNDGASDIAGTISSIDATATFTPSEALLSNKTYTVTITTGVQDLAGNAPASDYVWSFTTAPALHGVTILYERDGRLFRVNEDGTATTLIAASSNPSLQAHYLGISPSGKLVYDIAGTDLWTVNADGTGAVRLETGTATLSFKGFSSSGRLIYGLSGNLYSANADGSGKTVIATSFDTVKIAPAGRIVYRHAPSSGIDYTLHSVLDDGTEPIDLDGTAGIKVIEFVNAAGQVFYHRVIGSQNDAYVINADGTGFSEIAATTTYSESVVAQAPNGAIALSSCLLPACDSSLLTVGGTLFDLGRGSYHGVTQDNRFIVEQGPLGQFDLMAITTGGAMYPLSTDASVNDLFVAVHPDNRVIYRKPFSGTQCDIFSVKSDGSGTAVLANSTGYKMVLGISPTGRVVYATFLPSGAVESIYSVNSDGTDQRILVPASTNAKTFLGFSSSGKVLYADYTPYVGQDLFIVDHDGSAPVNLSKNPSVGTTTFFSSLP